MVCAAWREPRRDGAAHAVERHFLVAARRVERLDLGGARSRPARAMAVARSSTSRATMRPCGPEPRRRDRSMPASPASRRASGVTAMPPANRAGPKLRSGVRTSKNGSSLIGVCWRGCATGLAGRGGAACAPPALPARRGCAELAAAPVPSAITPTTAPTGATSPAGTRISASTPVVVDGTSIDTLSVSISNRLSPGLTVAPAATNHLVILPSATVSPSCGISTSMARSTLSSSAHADDLVFA